MVEGKLHHQGLSSHQGMVLQLIALKDMKELHPPRAYPKPCTSQPRKNPSPVDDQPWFGRVDPGNCTPRMGELRCGDDDFDVMPMGTIYIERILI